MVAQVRVQWASLVEESQISILRRATMKVAPTDGFLIIGGPCFFHDLSQSVK